jgi:predicted transcriptional regulator
MTRDTHLSDLQIAVMRVLWDQGEATVSDVHARLLEERGLAPTTIATVLSRLERRNLVDHRSEGRQFIYRAAVSEEEVRRSMVTELTDLLFEGDPAELVSHLLEARGVDSQELARLKALLEARDREERGAPDDR